MARTGKIARLPESVRTQLNHRLRDGALGPQLLPWLNDLPEVQAVLTEHFSGQPINAANLSDWRKGGFADWRRARDTHADRLERTRELAGMSRELAQASGANLTEGAAAILAGQILEVLEGMGDLRDLAESQPAAAADPAAADPSSALRPPSSGANAKHERLMAMAAAIDELSTAVTRLRTGDQVNTKLAQAERDLARKERELAHTLRLSAEKMLALAKDARVQEIADGDGDHAAKIEALGQLMFGSDWKPQA
jgi:hypothetical protein